MSIGTPQLSSSSSVSSSLLQRVKQHDPQAWEWLTKSFGPIVFGWARQCGLQESDAADVAQETFQAVAERVDSFERRNPNDSFRGWLWTITRNKVHDHFRRLAARPAAAGGTEAHLALQQIPDAFLDTTSTASGPSQSSDMVRCALELIRDDFEPNTWQAFWRSTIDGHSTAEIARDLNMQLSAVRQAKYRVLQRLRREIS
jgi:RNA polymerase sigma-70 factor (ECF subfamily)